MTKKNIWYISKYANIQPYGADTRQASFCKEFAKQHNTRLITSNSSHLYSSLPDIDGRYKDVDYENVEVTWVNTIKYSKATSVKRILSWIWFEVFVILMAFRKRYEKPDVVIASSLSLFSVLSGAFYKKFYKAKFIFEVRDIWPQTLIDLKGISPKHPIVWLLRKFERLGYKYADKIVGTMPNLAEHVEKELQLGHKVEFIPQGVNLSFYEDSQQSVEQDYIDQYIPKDKFIVTYAGTLGVAYALDKVIEAAKMLQQQGDTRVHFVFLGNGIEKQKLQSLSEQLTNVTFAPRVKKEQVLSVLKLSDVLLHSFKMEPVFEYGISPNKFVDYMYAKKPIVCMFSGFPSMLNEANCGEFIPSEDSSALRDTLLRYASLSQQERDEMGENGYQFLVEQRNFEVLSDKYLSMIFDNYS